MKLGDEGIARVVQSGNGQSHQQKDRRHIKSGRKTGGKQAATWLDENDLAEIDRRAERRGRSRSEQLRQMLKPALGVKDLDV